LGGVERHRRAQRRCLIVLRRPAVVGMEALGRIVTADLVADRAAALARLVGPHIVGRVGRGERHRESLRGRKEQIKNKSANSTRPWISQKSTEGDDPNRDRLEIGAPLPAARCAWALTGSSSATPHLSLLLDLMHAN